MFATLVMTFGKAPTFFFCFAFVKSPQHGEICQKPHRVGNRKCHGRTKIICKWRYHLGIKDGKLENHPFSKRKSSNQMVDVPVFISFLCLITRHLYTVHSVFVCVCGFCRFSLRMLTTLRGSPTAFELLWIFSTTVTTNFAKTNFGTAGETKKKRAAKIVDLPNDGRIHVQHRLGAAAWVQRKRQQDVLDKKHPPTS